METTQVIPDESAAENSTLARVDADLTAQPSSHHAEDEECSKCLPCKTAKRKRRIYRYKLLAGTILPFLLSSLDLTIVATATPVVARHFDKTSQQTWIVTAYTLTSTAFIPAFGQLADVFGRHSILQLTLALMTIGSVLCTVAPTWGVLILGRAFQGISAAGLTSVVSVILVDSVSLRENAKNNSIIQFFAGTAYCYGPVVGGYLTNSNWRWCFLISVPIAIFAAAVNFFLLRKELVKGDFSMIRSPVAGLKVVDVVGTFTFIAAISLIILAVTWGGASYSWSSVAVLVPLVAGLVLLATFPWYERSLAPGRAISKRFPLQSAMIPVSLFTRLDCIWLLIIQMAAGAALYSIFYYLAIYYILVKGESPARAGIQLLYYIIGIGTGSMGAAFMCNRYPGSTFWPIFIGTWAEAIGIGFVAYGVHSERRNLLIGVTVMAGYGTGTRFMPVTLHITGLWPGKRAQAQSMMRFALPFGGTVGLAVMGSVFNNKLAGLRGSFALGSVSPFSAIGGGASSHADILAGLPAGEVALIRSTARAAVSVAFLSILPILCLSCLATLLLGNVWIRGRPAATVVGEQRTGIAVDVAAVEEKPAEVGRSVEADMAPRETPSVGSSFVLQEPYLLALCRGSRYVEARRQIWLS